MCIFPINIYFAFNILHTISVFIHRDWNSSKILYFYVSIPKLILLRYLSLFVQFLNVSISFYSLFYNSYVVLIFLLFFLLYSFFLIFWSIFFILFFQKCNHKESYEGEIYKYLFKLKNTFETCLGVENNNCWWMYL